VRSAFELPRALPANTICSFKTGSIEKNLERIKKINMSEKKQEEKKQKKKRGGVIGFFRDFTYGMATHGMARHALKTRSSMEHLFILITMGDMLGIPILPPYYSLRLLPHVVPQITTWKRRMLREKDFVDSMY
jgi:hypothetical protein